MKSLKNEALAAISSLPDDTSVDEIMYRLYVIDKVRKGQETAETGKTIHQRIDNYSCRNS
jgi:hypothetical protein